MKKIALLATVAFCSTIGLVSCNNDDDSNNNSIVGEWEWVQTTVLVMNNGFEFIDYPHTEGCEKDYVIFGADQTTTAIYYDNTQEMDCSEYIVNDTYSINGNKITLGDAEVNSYNYSISNGELKLFHGDNEENNNYVMVLKRK